jgi:hypothetical protein
MSILKGKVGIQRFWLTSGKFHAPEASTEFLSIPQCSSTILTIAYTSFDYLVLAVTLALCLICGLLLKRRLAPPLLNAPAFSLNSYYYEIWMYS